jgi:hypothetical protein
LGLISHSGNQCILTASLELSRLPFATGAASNSYNKQHASTCLSGTRVDLLQTIYDWADGRDGRCMFWLNGLAGTGKSTIAHTVARRYFDQRRLGASFFFSRNGGDVGHAGKFFTTIAVQLARNIPQMQRYISDVIADDNDIGNQPLREQWHQLIINPLTKVVSRSQTSFVLVIDALDECDSEADIRAILNLLVEARTLQTTRLRIFLTSRAEVPIRHGFSKIPENDCRDFVLHSISLPVVSNDIDIYLRHNLDQIATERSLGDSWPNEQTVESLVSNASGLFIWAATACRFVREGKQFTAKRLATISKRRGGTTVIALEKHLDEIYLTVLRHAVSSELAGNEVEELCHMLGDLLGSIVTLFTPISTQCLSKLLDTPQRDVDETLDDLHAILDVPKDPASPIRLHHPSFRDFLLNTERCVDPNFQVDRKQAHQKLADCCIKLMSRSLKQDICKARAPGTLVDDIARSLVDQSLSDELQYACLYWVKHLQESGTQLNERDQVYQFLEVHLLHWLEALGWMQKLSEGIYAILSLESIALVSEFYSKQRHSD